MKNYLGAEASEHEMRLIQMGAKVEQINGKMCYVRFKIGSLDVEYVYNINGKNKYFLERIKPYPLPMREFEKEEDVIEIIDIDVRQFENALKSKNIDRFIEINKELNRTLRAFEDLFLYFNIPSEKAGAIYEKIKEIHGEIEHAQNTAERVFFEKDPDHLPI